MILNLVDYVKNFLFEDFKIDEKYCVISDTEIKSNWKFYKIDILEPVGQIVALKEKYKLVFIVLDSLNFDNIYRLYKNNISWICVLNLNSGYTWISKKTISPDLDDIYIKHNIEVSEPMDKENLLFFIEEFIENKNFKHIRIANKEIEEKVWWKELNMDYKEIINFNQFGIAGYSGTILVYGHLLQETLNTVWLFQSEWINFDMFWIWNYKKEFNKELIDSIDNQDKVFIIGDFDENVFKDFIYSKFYSYGLVKEDIHFITPKNIEKQVIDEFLAESVQMDPTQIYSRILECIR